MMGSILSLDVIADYLYQKTINPSYNANEVAK